jgi:hypothetical protein
VRRLDGEREASRQRKNRKQNLEENPRRDGLRLPFRTHGPQRYQACSGGRHFDDYFHNIQRRTFPGFAVALYRHIRSPSRKG